MRLVHAARAWLKARDLVTLLGALLGVMLVYGFLELGEVAKAGEATSFDDEILLACRESNDLADPIGPGWFEETMRDITALGSFAVIGLITMALVGYLLMGRRFRPALFVVSAVLGGLVLSEGLKFWFVRARPDVVPHLMKVSTMSFPSGHSTISAVLYPTLGVMLGRFSESRRIKAYWIALALFLAASVGFSRVYLGVHYPSDVLAGWAIGLTWALLCGLVARYLQRRGRLEVEKPLAAARDPKA
jgi:undecaprenyl-diphosphatase